MKIRVPASSANLGPGFDSFGLAWQLYNEISFEPADKLSFSGCDRQYQNEQNLCWRAYRHTLESAGCCGAGVKIDFGKTDIPVSRGLGSSAALITAGVLAADALHELHKSRQELFALATEVEGHPDNIAPAFFGGLTVSLMDGHTPQTRRFQLAQTLHFALLIPPFELSTALSRSVMPQQVSMQDAVFNLSRTALLPRALSDGDAGLLRIALQDRLHQPYRTGLIEGWDTAESLSKKLGAIGLCISGAGSTLLCIADDSNFGTRMKAAAATALPNWRVLEPLPDNEGACVL